MKKEDKEKVVDFIVNNSKTLEEAQSLLKEII
jgi:hypothetical protein